MLLWVSLLYAWVESVCAAVVIDGSQQRITLGSFLQEYEDVTGRMSLPDVMQKNGWQPSASEEPNKGFTRSVWWFRFRVARETPDDYPWYMVIDDAILNEVDAYFVRPSGEVLHRHGGGWVDVDQRDVPYRTHVFQLPVAQSGEIDVYVRVKSQLAIIVPIWIESAKSFMETGAQKAWAYSAYFGFVFAMLLFNLLVYIKMQERVNLYYCVFAFTAIMVTLTFSGFGAEFFWSGDKVDNFLLTLSTAWTGLAAIFFTDEFLSGGETQRTLRRVLRRRLITLLSIITTVIAVFGPVHIAIQCAAICCILSIINVFFNSLISVYQGNRNAFLVLVAWSGLLVGTLVFCLRAFGVIPSNIITTNAFMLGAVFECFMLVVALVEKSRSMEQDIDRVSRDALESLEEQVRQRTLELSAAESELKRLHKKKSFDTLVDSMSQSFIPVIANIKQRNKASASRSAELRAWLQSLVEGDGEIMTEIDHVFSRLTTSGGLIEDGVVRIESVLSRLAIPASDAGTKNGSTVSWCVECIDRLCSAWGLECEQQWQCAEDATLMVPQDILEDILNEILKNARDAMACPSDSESRVCRVEITGQDQKDCLLINIRDYGVGMSEEIVGRVFDPFFTTKTVGVGTGLGLTKVRELLDTVGGDISIESRPGDGACCRLRLPKERGVSDVNQDALI